MKEMTITLLLMAIVFASTAMSYARRNAELEDRIEEIQTTRRLVVDVGKHTFVVWSYDPDTIVAHDPECRCGGHLN